MEPSSRVLRNAVKCGLNAISVLPSTRIVIRQVERIGPLERRGAILRLPQKSDGRSERVATTNCVRWDASCKRSAKSPNSSG